jgi:hypothetical protein
MRSEIHSRDGINYEIVAANRDGNHVATWKCLRCPGVGGKTTGGYCDLDGVIGAAKALLYSEHHSRAHLGPVGQKR